VLEVPCHVGAVGGSLLLHEMYPTLAYWLSGNRLVSARATLLVEVVERR
jgi:hypothetical protein